MLRMKSEEARLRDLVSQLKVVRTSVQSTVVELDAFEAEERDGVEIKESQSRNRAADLELAVLVQVIHSVLQGFL
jgi:hypothetical protein